MYYRNAQAALVVYDVTRASSLGKARHWVAELQRQASPGIVVCLVGNKVDLAEEDGEANGTEGEGDVDGEDTAAAAKAAPNDDGTARKVSTREAKAYAEEEGLLFFETSAKSGLNVGEVFTAIANAIPEASLKGGRAGANAAAGAGTQAAIMAGAEGSSKVNLNKKAGSGEGGQEGCAC